MTTSSRDVFVGIETGGTKTVCRVVDDAGRALTQSLFPTVTPDRVVDTLVGLIGAVIPPGSRIAGVGLATFGPVILDPRSPERGRMIATTKAGWSGFNLTRVLEERLGVPVATDTDVNAAALAEQTVGAGRGLQTVAYVTVGTGIGGGLVSNGCTLKGALHPEIGHLPLRRAPGDDQVSLCEFHASCAEGLTAGPAVGRRLAGQKLADAPEVRALLVDYLGQLCATLVLSWSPQRIVLGGGVMSGPGLIPDIESRMRTDLNGYGAGEVAHAPGYLAPAELEHAGLEGALIMARRMASGE